MNIKFEKGRNHDMDTDKKVKPAVSQPKADTSAEEKARLQAVLTEAGVEFKPQHGIAKLQALVDNIEVEVDDALAE